MSETFWGRHQGENEPWMCCVLHLIASKSSSPHLQIRFIVLLFLYLHGGYLASSRLAIKHLYFIEWCFYCAKIRYVYNKHLQPRNYTSFSFICHWIESNGPKWLLGFIFRCSPTEQIKRQKKTRKLARHCKMSRHFTKSEISYCTQMTTVLVLCMVFCFN